MARIDSRLLRIAFLAAGLCTIGGCSSIMQSILFGISERTVSRKVKVFVADAPRGRGEADWPALAAPVPEGFRTHMANEAGRPETTAAQRQRARVDIALAVMEDETARALFRASDDLIAAGLASGNEPKKTIQVPSNCAGWTELSRKLEEAALTDSWSALADESAAYAAAAEATEKGRARAFAKRIYYIRKYVRAYFTGPLVEVRVDLAEFVARLKKSLEEDLKRRFPGIDAGELAAKLQDLLVTELKAALGRLLKDKDPAKLNQVLDDLLAGNTVNVWGYSLPQRAGGSAGFTNRAGETFRWPTVAVTISSSAPNAVSWSDIDARDIGSQLLRVFIEAVFDSSFEVPGVGTATAVGFPPEFQLPEFKAGDSGVTAAEFETLNDWAGRAEGIAGSGVGQLIRGVGWISLNNEALAGLIETAVGVTVRKLVEKGLWLRYQGNGGEREDAFAADRGRFVEIEFVFTNLSRPPAGDERR